jgi:hypothetical protein
MTNSRFAVPLSLHDAAVCHYSVSISWAKNSLCAEWKKRSGCIYLEAFCLRFWIPAILSPPSQLPAEPERQNQPFTSASLQESLFRPSETALGQQPLQTRKEERLG